MSKNKYLKTNAHGFNHAHGKIGLRLEHDSMHITEIERMKDRLLVGGTYKIRESYFDSGKFLRTRTTEMECVGIYPHMAVFRTPRGHNTAFSYTDLCHGGLENVSAYEEEELI